MQSARWRLDIKDIQTEEVLASETGSDKERLKRKAKKLRATMSGHRALTTDLYRINAKGQRIDSVAVMKEKFAEKMKEHDELKAKAEAEAAAVAERKSKLDAMQFARK